jgi:lysophospholipase L1-like esterase
MLECLILGDSIAVGTIQARPGCVEMAKGGINSWQWNKQFSDRPALDGMEYKFVVISLGSNDHKGVNTEKEILAIREKVIAKHVYWILPAIKPDVQAIVQKVAGRYGDTVLPIRTLSKDGVHPTGKGYKEIAETLK